MTIFALEQCVENGVDLNICDAESALEEVAALRAEKDRLTTCLEKANASAEHFEREWYLRGDEIDTLRAAIDAAKGGADGIR